MAVLNSILDGIIILSKGNEAFVAENYASAIDLYTAALGIDPLFADCLVAR